MSNAYSAAYTYVVRCTTAAAWTVYYSDVLPPLFKFHKFDGEATCIIYYKPCFGLSMFYQW